MPSQATLEAKGLWTNVNALSGAPPGSTSKQVNMRVHKPGLMTPRRGRKSICSLDNAFLRVFDAGSFLIAFAADNQVYTSSDNGVTWSLMLNWVDAVQNVYPAWGLAHFYSFGLNKSFFFTTRDGIQVVSTTSGGYRPAGVPYGLNAKIRSYNTAGTAMPPNSRVGYRAVFGIRNPDGSVELGAPSQRAIAINASTTETVNPLIEIVIPPGIVQGKHFWQLYRTYPSVDAAVDPGDEMSLVFEGGFNPSFTTSGISRTDNRATITTAGPHGAAIGDVVNLDTRYDPPADPGTVIDRMSDIPANRTLASAAIRHSVIFGSATPAFEADIPLGAAEVGIAGSDGVVIYPQRRWLWSNSLGIYVLIHPQLKQVRLYKAGNNTSFLNISVADGANTFNVDAAALSADEKKLYIICPNTSTPTAAYSYNAGMKLGVVDLVTHTITWAAGVGALPTQPTPTGSDVGGGGLRSALWCAPCFVTKGADGIERLFVTAAWHYTTTTLNASRQTSVDYFWITPGGSAWTFYVRDLASQIEGVQANGPARIPPFKYCQEQVICNDGNVRAFIGYSGQSTSNRVMNGLVATIFVGPVVGFNIDKTATVFSSYYRTQNASTFTLGVRRYPAGNFSVAGPVDSVLLTFASTVANYTDGNGYRGPNGTAYIEYWTTNTGVKNSYRLADYNSNTPVLIANETIAAPSYGSQGSNNPSDSIFYEGTYVIVAVPDASSFQVESIGPDFFSAPYVAVVNNNVVSIIDNVAPGAVGPALYTSPSQEGIGNSNYPPPFAKDVETFRSYGFYANATVQAYLAVTLFSVGTETIDLQVGDLVTIGNFTLTASATEDFALGHFKVTLDSGSAYENIRLTVESLSECVNRYADARHGCVVVKNEDTVSPGSFYIRSLYFDENITFVVKRGTAIAMGGWSPSEQATAIPTQQPNALYYSKPANGGAVPLGNFVRVGTDTSPILRVKATREVLFVFKPEGIFAMRGYAPPWQVDPFDLSNALMLPDALCQMDNNIFCATDHGIMKVSDSGIELISLPIQNLIEEQYSTQTGQLTFSAERAFMFGDPSDHKLHLMLPRPPADDPADNNLLVYDTYTNTWFNYGWNGRFDLGVGADDPYYRTLYYSNQENHGLYYRKTNTCIWVNDTEVFTERKSYTDDDYVDDESINTIVSWQDPVTKLVLLLGTPVTSHSLVGSFVAVAGDIFIVLEHPTPDTVRVNKALNVSIGSFPLAATFSFPVWTDVQYNCTYEVNGAALNHFREVNTLFKTASFKMMRVVYIRPAEPSDSGQERIGIVIINGETEFDSGLSIQHFQTRTLVPKEQQRCSVLEVGFQLPVYKANNEIEGMTILFNPGPMRRRR